MPDLSIIIPHFNDADRLAACLAALEGQVGQTVEVIVVDNGSDPEHTPARDLYPWVRWAVQPLKGAGLARNLGVALASSTRFAFLDCDCIPSSTWVAQALLANVDRTITGGKVETFDEGQSPVTGAQLFERVFAFDNRQYVVRSGFSVTANMVISKQVFELLGLFRSDVAEDLEWCLRAPAYGVGLAYDDALCVLHPTRADWPALRRKWRRLMHQSFETTGKGYLARLAWVGRASLTTISILRDIPVILRSKKIAGRKNRLLCLCVLCRLRLARTIWMGRQAITGQA